MTDNDKELERAIKKLIKKATTAQERKGASLEQLLKLAFIRAIEDTRGDLIGYLFDVVMIYEQ